MSVQRYSRSFVDGQIAGLHQSGKKGPLLLLHGNSSSKEIFLPLLELMGSLDFECLAIDLPGHGDSENASQPEQSYCFPGYARVAEAVIQEAGWESAGLIGWSLGGHIVLECLAADDCGRWTDALVIGAPPCRCAPDDITAAFNTTDVMMLAGKDTFDESDAHAYVSAMLDGEDQVTAFLLARAVRTDGRARRVMLESALAGIGADHLDVVSQTKARLALVLGRADVFLNTEYFDAIPTGNLWERKVHSHPDWGHAPHWKKDAHFVALVRRFFNET